MAKDFFDNLGKTISKAAGTAVNMTEDFFAITKIKGKIAEEDRMIEKICRKIGHEVYKEYKSGTVYSEVIAELCKDIERHEEEKFVQQKNLDLFNEKKEEDIVEEPVEEAPVADEDMFEEEPVAETVVEAVAETVEEPAAEEE